MSFESIINLTADGLVRHTFGSPELAGIFALIIILFILFKMGVSLDGVVVVTGTSFLLMAVSGIFSFEFIVWPVIIIMLVIIGLAVLRILRR